MEWCFSKCGKYRIECLSATTFPQAIKVLKEAFYTDESVSIAVEVNKNTTAAEELSELCADAALDGVSLVAVAVDTGEVVAVAFNKLQVPPSGSSEKPFFEVFAEERCTQKESKALIAFMVDADSRCNLFEKYKADCSLEIMFLATLSAHRGHHLGQLLCQMSEKVAKKLQGGAISNFSVQDLSPSYSHMKPRSVPNIPPKICQAIWTTFITQKIGKNLSFDVAVTIPYTEYEYEGVSFSDRIGPLTPFCEVAAKVVE